MSLVTIQPQEIDKEALMSYFENLELKPLSLQILMYIYEHDGLQAKEIAEALNVGTRQVDAAISKSLQRYSLAIRLGKLTPLKKKEYNVITITSTGKAYVAFLKEKEEEIHEV